MSDVPLSISQFREAVKQFGWRRSVNEVHLHHTWQPNHKTWKGAASVRGMRNYHKGLGWIDIAQHVTIGPDGSIWIGRNWNFPPASNGRPNRNGNRQLGPFMIETVGNFDKGNDVLEGPQLRAVLAVIGIIMDHFHLETYPALRFHRQLGSPKTCPGTSIDYDHMVNLVNMQRKMGWDAPRPAGAQPWYRRMWLTPKLWRRR